MLYMEHFQKLSVNTYKLLRVNLEPFSNVVIDIGDFHCLKGNFKVIFLLYDHLLSNLK